VTRRRTRGLLEELKLKRGDKEDEEV